MSATAMPAAGSPTARTPLAGPAAWYGAELDRSGAWIRTLDDAQRREIDAALAHVKRQGFSPLGFGRADFPLHSTADLLAAIAAELEDGRGMVRLRGVPVDRYSEDDLRTIFWGLGRHLGTAVYQNATGEIMGEVRDETRLAQQSFTPVEAGKVASSRARSRSTGPLRWHTDRCDVIALMCVSNAQAGGVSKLASIVTIYNEILRRRPDLLELLCQDYWRARPADEDGLSPDKVFAMPVFGLRDGRITSQYSRTYVEQAQEVAGVPRLTAAQNEALDMLAAVAEEVCLHSPFVPGDIQLLNNHVVYHGRTAYEDNTTTHQERLLLRLWLAVPNSRRLPEGFETLWGSAAPGALRGGVVQPGTGSRVPVETASA
ncbi:TauD/TfdA family dioxygenase [Limobrevibacterium gyesilva]|uniref:TauD/TfdA family dioxygenase n=1 Tax=Limobrevibacterium gyesilva TaxID=2991712 RepID=A0AA41YSX0_9PROT|nr:TauD/TfdA family dioxygenase [Limobrevibacterium gyesilva]MCW3475900.1 TauD/TfdA family dioxygenase [Limobrevibacterium gyesilva]